MVNDYLYVDKNGETIEAGMLLRFSDGSIEKVYETTNMNGDPDLGINASNEAYMEAHGIPEEFREYYSLDNFRKDDIEIVHEEGA